MNRHSHFLLTLLIGWSLGNNGFAADDPVASFEKLVAKLEQHKFTDRRCSEFKYDVKKTDSLVTPIVGVLTFKVGEKPDLAAEIHRYQFSFHNGRWTFDSGVVSVWAPSIGEGERSPILAAENKSIQACLEER